MRCAHLRLFVAAAGLALGLSGSAAAQPAPQQPPPPAYIPNPTLAPGQSPYYPTAGIDAAAGLQPALPRMYYYPYYYFPHSYWPQNSPQWPEPKGHPYVRPPAYMAYPPFREPGWRYELWTPMKYYRGNHFWLDQF